MTLWKQRKPLDELTNLLAAKACVEIGWAAYARGLSNQVDTDITDLLNDDNVRQLWKMGIKQLERGLMEKACEAFRAAARVILAQDK